MNRTSRVIAQVALSLVWSAALIGCVSNGESVTRRSVLDPVPPQESVAPPPVTPPCAPPTPPPPPPPTALHWEVTGIDEFRIFPDETVVRVTGQVAADLVFDDGTRRDDGLEALHVTWNLTDISERFERPIDGRSQVDSDGRFTIVFGEQLVGWALQNPTGDDDIAFEMVLGDDWLDWRSEPISAPLNRTAFREAQANQYL